VVEGEGWRVALWRKKARMAIPGGRQYHGSGQRREEAATSVLAGEKRRAAKHQESSDRNEAGENPNRLELDGPDYKLGRSDG